jgi:hypothetical protein
MEIVSRRRESLYSAAKVKEMGMKRLAGSLAVIAIAAMPVGAGAQLQTYHHAGAWDAFSGRGESGGPECGVGTTNPSGGRRLAMRFEIGGSNTTLSASKPEWSVPDNTHVTVVMQVGLNTPWTLQALGHDRSIEWQLDPAAMQAFDRQFRGASSLTLTFPDGNEPPWVVPLAGSTAISDTFGRCIRDLTRQLQARLPHSDKPPTPQETTQPFAAPVGAAAPPTRAGG